VGLPRPEHSGRRARHRPGCHSRRCDRFADRAYARHHRPRLPWSTEASWYEDAGATASGEHYALGVASHYEGACDACGLPFGMRVRICLGSRCIVARVQDRGPYVAGRELDLNPGARDALGCDGVCTVRYGPG
jgi:Lytic transglycolase